MSDLTDDLRRVLVRELETFRREIELFPDDQSLWRTAPGIVNPAGTLALHLAGNLQHFIGGVLGGTGYRRDREAEFSRRALARSEVIAQLDAAIAVVQDVMGRLPAGRDQDPFPEPVAGVRLSTSACLCHLATHAAYHLGQASYLRRVLTGDSRTSGAVSPLALAPSDGAPSQG